MAKKGHLVARRRRKAFQDEYKERAQLVNLDSLPCRVDKGDMILVIKILHGFVEGVLWQDFFQITVTSRLRGHPLKLRKDSSRLDLRKFTFSQRVVNMWNDLPAEVVTASSAKMFKNKLEVHLKKISLDGRQKNRNRTRRPCLCT